MPSPLNSSTGHVCLNLLGLGFLSQVRIEDDIAVTADGMELLTCVPRTVQEIEEFMEVARSDPKSFSPVTKKFWGNRLELLSATDHHPSFIPDLHFMKGKLVSIFLYILWLASWNEMKSKKNH